MIVQLVKRIIDGVPSRPARPEAQAIEEVLAADPLDLMLFMEQVWEAAAPWGAGQPSGGAARRALWLSGEFAPYAPIPGIAPMWEHLGYSYVLENTRAVQILRRVLREYRSGEGLGVPSVLGQQWLDATEALLFGASGPTPTWLSTSVIRQDPEAVRRNAYWRFFGMDLAFGTDDNRPPIYDKANAANTNFVQLFEELLFEIWQSMTNVRNVAGVNASDDDRIYRLAEALQMVLSSRRQVQTLMREELAAATVLGWVELTLSGNTAIVRDLKADATSPAERLRLIGDRVGMAPHSRTSSLISMCAELSVFLRAIESGIVTGPEFAWVLYLEQVPPALPVDSPKPLGAEARRVITEWAAATGKDLKVRGKPVEVSRPRLVAAR